MSNNFYYLATVYRKHPDGLDAAAEEAARYAALFIDAGVPVFAPVPHSHPIARFTSIPAHDSRWLQLQLPFMKAACGMILVEMQNWRKSEGIAFERIFFQKLNRPVYRVSTVDPVGEFMKMSGLTEDAKRGIVNELKQFHLDKMQYYLLNRFQGTCTGLS